MTIEQAKYVLRKHRISVKKKGHMEYLVRQIGYDDEIMTEGQVIELALGFGEEDGRIATV